MFKLKKKNSSISLRDKNPILVTTNKLIESTLRHPLKTAPLHPIWKIFPRTIPRSFVSKSVFVLSISVHHNPSVLLYVTIVCSHLQWFSVSFSSSVFICLAKTTVCACACYTTLCACACVCVWLFFSRRRACIELYIYIFTYIFILIFVFVFIFLWLLFCCVMPWPTFFYNLLTNQQEYRKKSKNIGKSGKTKKS